MYFANKNNGEIPLQSLTAYFDEVKLRKRGVSDQTGALLQRYILQIVKCLSIAGVFQVLQSQCLGTNNKNFHKNHS